MIGLDGPQLADQGVELGVGDLRGVEPVVAVVVIGDEGPELLGAGHGVAAVPHWLVPFRLHRLLGAHPAMPDPTTVSGWSGS